MFPINLVLGNILDANCRTLHSTMFPINLESLSTDLTGGFLFTFHYVSY